jgi:hypothetical protein
LFSSLSSIMGLSLLGALSILTLANDDDPSRHTIEITTQEQVFSPLEHYQSYIRVKGITFQHAGNGFPVPQRGMVSTNRGNHFISEDNTFEWANSVGLDIGNEDWQASRPPPSRSASMSFAGTPSAIAASRGWAGRGVRGIRSWSGISSSGSAGRTRP